MEHPLKHTFSAKSRYDMAAKERQPILDRARDAALLTQPSLLPPESWTISQRLPTPFQSIGARGLNNISAKLGLTLLPANTSFVKLELDTFQAENVGVDETQKKQIEGNLQKVEKALVNELEVGGYRIVGYEGINHAVFGGNALFESTDDERKPLRFFRLDQYIIVRDALGNLDLIIIEEKISPANIPEDLHELLKRSEETKTLFEAGKDIWLHTVIERVSDTEFESWQEYAGVMDPESVSVHAEETLPWFHTRWKHVSGSAYGTGYVEEYLGDLTSLEGLSQAVVEGSAAIARILFLTNPNGMTKPRILEEAPNGAVRTGRAEDITVMQADKAADLAVAQSTIRDIRDRLGFAFLLNSSVARDAERVTAEEIRFIAQELDDQLGGAHAMLGQEFQRPLAMRLIDKLQAQGRIPKVSSKAIQMKVVTGVEALGRAHELNRIRTFISLVTEAFGPEVAHEYLKTEDLIQRIANMSQLDEPNTALRTEEERNQISRTAQVMQLVEQLGPNAVNVLGQLVQQQQNTNPAQPTAPQPQQ